MVCLNKSCKRVKKGGETYTTMSAISAPSLLGGLVHLDVLDDQVARIETLGIGVGFGVLEEAEEELGGFDGPAGFGDAELFACCVWSRALAGGFIHSGR